MTTVEQALTDPAAMAGNSGAPVEMAAKDVEVLELLMLADEVREAKAGSHELSERVLRACGVPCHRHRPDPTSKQDDALNLLPSGWKWDLSNHGYLDGKYLDGKAFFAISPRLEPTGRPRWQGIGRTPPLAICVTALMLRAIDGLYWAVPAEPT